MNDEHLSESLRHLPESAAGEGFTRAVLTRLAAKTDPSGERSTDPWATWPQLAGIAAALVVVALAALLVTSPGALAPWIAERGSSSPVPVPGSDSGASTATEPAKPAEPVQTAELAQRTERMGEELQEKLEALALEIDGLEERLDIEVHDVGVDVEVDEVEPD